MATNKKDLARKLREKKPHKEPYPPRVLLCDLKGRGPSALILADTIGVTSVTMYRILEGCDIKVSHALKISKLLNCSIEDIWKLKEAVSGRSESNTN